MCHLIKTSICSWSIITSLFSEQVARVLGGGKQLPCKFNSLHPPIEEQQIDVYPYVGCVESVVEHWLSDSPQYYVCKVLPGGFVDSLVIYNRSVQSCRLSWKSLVPWERSCDMHNTDHSFLINHRKIILFPLNALQSKSVVKCITWWFAIEYHHACDTIPPEPNNIATQLCISV